MGRFQGFPARSIDVPIKQVLNGNLRVGADRCRLALGGEGNADPFDLPHHPLTKFVESLVRTRRAFQRGDFTHERPQNGADGEIVGVYRINHGSLLAAAKLLSGKGYHEEVA